MQRCAIWSRTGARNNPFAVPTPTCTKKRMIGAIADRENRCRPVEHDYRRQRRILRRGETGESGHVLARKVAGLAGVWNLSRSRLPGDRVAGHGGTGGRPVAHHLLEHAHELAADALIERPLAHYRGDLLPDDPYETWAEAARERLRRHALALLDLCAASAASAGDLDEAVRCLERAIEMAPDEEERYLGAARHLLTQGRRGAARAMAARARQVLSELGLSPPRSLLELEQRVR